MKNNVKVSLEKGVNELVLRTGDAEKIHVIPGVALDGLSIGAVREFLSKPLLDNEENRAIEWTSFIVFDYAQRKISLDYNYRTEHSDKISGILEIDPELNDFGINNNKSYSALEMGQFIRFRRHYFESKDVALELEKNLKQFKATVDKKIEAADDKRGNIQVSIAQTVISNLPLDFYVKLPVFIGTEKVLIKVEIDINPMDLTCCLVSPELKEMIDLESKAIIDFEIEEIKKLHPALRIFQK